MSVDAKDRPYAAVLDLAVKGSSTGATDAPQNTVPRSARKVGLGLVQNRDCRSREGSVTLPFTPFHMGAGLVVKPGMDRNFSVISFGIAQVAMDVEPGIGMLTGAAVLHGPSHTVLGALVIACLVMLVAPWVCNLLLRRWNKEVTHYGWTWWVQAETPPKKAVVLGAFFGTLSHVALDSLMHDDIQPLLPFSGSNPLLGLVTYDAVYQACVVASVLGAAAWLSIQWTGRNRRADDRQAPLPATSPRRLWVVWVHDLRFTWFWALLLSAAPALLLGSNRIPLGVLMVAIGIGIPTVAIGRVFRGRWPIEASRRLAVTALMATLALVYVFQTDARIPDNATPIVLALDAFYRETGRYPDSMDEIVPTHLRAIPTLKASIVQPPVRYRMWHGQPRLTIPSAKGDAFAAYEYDFTTRVWVHHN